MLDILKTRPYYDLCLEEQLFMNEDIEKTIKNLYNLGYRTIAINQTFDDMYIEPKKKKKKGESREEPCLVPLPYDLSNILEVVKSNNLENFNILNRLTVVFSTQDVLYKITKTPNYKKYDLIAACPTTMHALSYTCGNFEADILTYNPENRWKLRLNRKMYNQLIERGFYLELQYSHAIEDSTKRKNLIHLSHLYHSFGKSKNILFSSGAQNSLFIRNPYDIISLGFIFGLNELQCKSSVQHCPKKVILNAVGRRHGKAVMFVENIPKDKDLVDLVESDMEVDEQPKQKKIKVTL